MEMQSSHISICLLLLISLMLAHRCQPIAFDGRIPPPPSSSSSAPSDSNLDFMISKNGGSRESSGNFEPVKVLCEVNGFIVPAIIDTGAQISIMSAACAKRCHVTNIDTRFAGRAIGVGSISSEILGRANGLAMRIGPVNFQNNISILKQGARVDFLIGLDFLRRFNCEVSLKEGVLKIYVRNRLFKVPFEQEKNFEICCEDELNTPAGALFTVPSNGLIDEDEEDRSDEDNIGMEGGDEEELGSDYDPSGRENGVDQYASTHSRYEQYESNRGAFQGEQRWKGETKRRRAPQMSMEGV